MVMPRIGRAARFLVVDAGARLSRLLVALAVGTIAFVTRFFLNEDGSVRDTRWLGTLLRILPAAIQWTLIERSLQQSDTKHCEISMRRAVELAALLPVPNHHCPINSALDEEFRFIFSGTYSQPVQGKRRQDELSVYETASFKQRSRLLGLGALKFSLARHFLSVSAISGRPKGRPWAIWWVLTHPRQLFETWRRLFAYEVFTSESRGFSCPIPSAYPCNFEVVDTMDVWSRILLGPVTVSDAAYQLSGEILTVGKPRFAKDAPRGESGNWILVAVRDSPRQLLSLLSFWNNQQLLEFVLSRREIAFMHSGFAQISSDIQGKESPTQLTVNLRVPTYVDETTKLAEITSHAAFSEFKRLEVDDVVVHHGRFVTRDKSLVIFDSGSDIRADSVAGLWPWAWSSGVSAGRGVVVPGIGRTDEFEEAICGFGRADTNWFHWLTETLPRVLLASQDLNNKVPILIRSDLPSSARESLQILGPRPIVEIRPYQAVNVRRLHTVTARSATMDSPWLNAFETNFSRTSIQFLRQGLRDLDIPRSVQGLEKILMLRKSSYRNIKNIHRVRSVAKKFGFIDVDFSLLSFAEQVHIMRNARAAVIQGGAAVTSVALTEGNPQVCVLASTFKAQDRFWKEFLEVCGVSGTVISEQRGKKTGGGTSDAHKDFSVNIVDLERVLTQMEST